MKDGAIIALKTVMTKRTHSRVILPYVTSLMEELSIGLEDIDLVAVANGPGSYTGLRIGVSTVKGLCYDNKRCIGISTLEGLAANCLCAACRIVPVMYARPGTVYFGAYISDGERLIPQQPDRVGSVDDLLALLEALREEPFSPGTTPLKLSPGLAAVRRLFWLPQPQDFSPPLGYVRRHCGTPARIPMQGGFSSAIFRLQRQKRI